MANFETDYEIISPTVHKCWVVEDGKLNTKRLVYKLDKKSKRILFYPKKGEFVTDKIVIEGFDKLPDDFSENGYIKQGIQYYLNKKLRNFFIKDFIISKERASSFRKNIEVDTIRIVLNYNDFRTLRSKFLQLYNNSIQTKNDIIDDLFYKLFPGYFDESKKSTQFQYRSVIRNLSSDIIDHITPADLLKIEGFMIELLEKKYTNNAYKFLQLARTKVKIDTLTIDRILEEFNQNIKDGISESQWGKYLQKNLFLLDSKYIKIIPELNVILSSSRNVDFGMIDTKGYLDIFEIKKPDTLLLSAETDRGNYYWHTQTVKALVQAEKYLFNAERKAPSLAEDIRREEKINVKVVKPRAILIIGHSNQLDCEEKRDDFKVLRQSLKNIDIILYDELLEGLENQKNKYYDQIAIHDDESRWINTNYSDLE